MYGKNDKTSDNYYVTMLGYLLLLIWVELTQIRPQRKLDPNIIEGSGPDILRTTDPDPAKLPDPIPINIWIRILL